MFQPLHLQRCFLDLVNDGIFPTNLNWWIAGVLVAINSILLKENHKAQNEARKRDRTSKQHGEDEMIKTCFFFKRFDIYILY